MVKKTCYKINHNNSLQLMPDSSSRVLVCLHKHNALLVNNKLSMDILKKASLPSIEDYAKQLTVRKNLTAELGRSIRSLQEENVGKSVIADTDESANALCCVIEAIFIHGLKDKLSSKVSSVFSSNNDKMPEPEFWSFVSKNCHKNVITEIKNLSQISSDIGRCRAWLRIALNDGLVVSYLGTVLSDKPSLQKFYYTTAYLRDEEQSDIMKQLLEGTSIYQFELSCNSSSLNSWSCVPLTLANIWSPPATPQPVMPAVDVIDFFTEQKNQGKSFTKSDTIHIKNETADSEIESISSPKSNVNVPCTLEASLPADKKDDSVSDNKDLSHEDQDIRENCKQDSNANDRKPNEAHNCNLKDVVSECDENEDASSKISSSGSVPDFGNETAEDSSEVPRGSYGNKLNEKSGWSSVFDDEREQRDNEASQSYDSLLQSYNKNLSKVVIGTPELADTFSSIMGRTDDYIVIDKFAII